VIDWLAEAYCSQFVCSFILLLPKLLTEYLKTNEQILMETGTSGLQGEGMQRSTLGSNVKSHNTKVGFDPFGRVDFLLFV